jgi:predicted nucleic acid-binding protein
MTLLVVDSSVAVKWFVPEIHSDSAVALLDVDNDLHAPDLLLAETGNILWKKVNRGELTAETARKVAEALTASALNIHASSPLVTSALDIALGLSRTVYDCLYLALALSLACPFVTADERLFNAVQSSPFGSQLRLVYDVD